MGRIEFFVDVDGKQVTRFVVRPRGLEQCRASAIEAADAAATPGHAARVYMVEAPYDIGPMVGDRQLVYETPATD